MSKRRRSKIDVTERGLDAVARIEWARAETISRLGIGGYVPAADICNLYNEMDAWLFAEIMYATEDMLSDYGMEEAVNATHIPATIARCKARRRSHFREVAAIFTRHVGADRVSLRDTPE